MTSWARGFVDAFTESTVTQFVLVVLVFGTIAYLSIAGTNVPSELYTFAGLIIGYFFRSKATSDRSIRN